MCGSLDRDPLLNPHSGSVFFLGGFRSLCSVHFRSLCLHRWCFSVQLFMAFWLPFCQVTLLVVEFWLVGDWCDRKIKFLYLGLCYWLLVYSEILSEIGLVICFWIVCLLLVIGLFCGMNLVWDQCWIGRGGIGNLSIVHNHDDLAKSPVEVLVFH